MRVNDTHGVCFALLQRCFCSFFCGRTCKATESRADSLTFAKEIWYTIIEKGMEATIA